MNESVIRLILFLIGIFLGYILAIRNKSNGDEQGAREQIKQKQN